MKCGQAVQIGDVAVVKVEHKRAETVRLTFFTNLAPIRLIASGIIPQRFTHGITGEPRRILEPLAATA